jgi:hypothetical protein
MEEIYNMILDETRRETALSTEEIFTRYLTLLILNIAMALEITSYAVKTNEEFIAWCEEIKEEF